MTKQYWEEHRDNGQRMVDYAERMLGNRPGEIGAVPVRRTCEVSPEQTAEEIAEASIRLAGADAVLGDRHRMYESDFNALVAYELAKGRIDWPTAEEAMINFHVYMTGNRSPQTSPRFYQ